MTSPIPTVKVATMSPLTRRTLGIAQAGEGLIDFLGAVPIPKQPIVVDGHGRTDWIILDARIDPHFQAGTLGIPRQCVRHLRKIDKAGIEFDGLLIGHELAPGTAAKFYKGTVPAGVDMKTVEKQIGPPPTDAHASKAAKVAEFTTKAVTMTGIGLGVAAGALALAPLAALAALDLDPVLFGFVTDDPDARPGALAALFYLTSWTNGPA